MIEERVQYARDHFFVDGFFAENAVRYELKEHEKSGQAQLILSVGTEDNICVENYDEKKNCEYLSEKNGLKKAVDHFVLIKREDHWELHLIEMKTTVDSDQWTKIKYQMRSSYLNLRALIQFLGVSVKDEHIYAYTAYGNDCMESKQTTNPRMFYPKLGERAIDPKKDEWDSGYINLPLIRDVFVKLCHKKVQMNRANSDRQLEGTLAI